MIQIAAPALLSLLISQFGHNFVHLKSRIIIILPDLWHNDSSKRGVGFSDTKCEQSRKRLKPGELRGDLNASEKWGLKFSRGG